MQLAPSLSTTTFKQAFLRSMLLGLNAAASSSNNMSFEARKCAVKLAADIAMARARGRRAKWARALVADLSAKHQNNGTGALLKNMLGGKYKRLVKGNQHCCRIQRSKKILRRSHRMCSTARREEKVLHASVVAKSMVKRRTKMLKKIIPGGEVLNGLSLLNEALDYVISLQAQVELMRSLLKATEESKSNRRASSKDQLKHRGGS